MNVNMQELILIRGLPGSGKSTLANQLLRIKTHTLINVYYHFEADMYFLNCANQYIFDKNQLPHAHSWCQRSVDLFLNNHFNVIVSNTFTTKKELRPYFQIAKKYDIIPQVILCQGNYQSSHNVPQETIKKMKLRFQYDIKELYNE